METFCRDNASTVSKINEFTLKVLKIIFVYFQNSQGRGYISAERKYVRTLRFLSLNLAAIDPINSNRLRLRRSLILRNKKNSNHESCRLADAYNIIIMYI